LRHFERAGVGSPIEQAFLEASRLRLRGLRALSAVGVLIAGSLALAAAGVSFDHQPAAMSNWLVHLPWAWARARVGYYPLPEMRPIPAGEFSMGEKGEQHHVLVPAFRLGRHELTFAEYDVFVFAARSDPKVPDECKTLPDDQSWGRGRRPVINVSWDCAKAYAAWLTRRFPEEKTYRLPTEAEWEYAARAHTVTDYWWGDDMGKNRANCSGCGSEWDGKQTAPVGSFAANRFRLYDTAGNVWEWVQDCWHDSYDGAPPDGTAWEQEGGDCGMRVRRGGSWYFGAPSYLRSAYRDWYPPDTRIYFLGFRLAQDK
jgi:formylglycine-generating enzyme required for sulfatase activity